MVYNRHMTKRILFIALLALIAAPQAFACPSSEKEIKAKFAKYDTNGDGFITKEEALPALQKDVEENLKYARDPNAYVHPAELSVEKLWQEFWQPLDKDGDGKISLVEFHASQYKAQLCM